MLQHYASMSLKRGFLTGIFIFLEFCKLQELATTLKIVMLYDDNLFIPFTA